MASLSNSFSMAPVLDLSVMVKNIEVPLSNISLSVEMLSPLLEDDGYKLFLEVILRNSVRIKDQLDGLLAYQQTLLQH